MPKLSKEMEEKIVELIDQKYKDADISRKLGVHRTTVANRRKEYLKQKPVPKKPEPEQEETVQQEQTDSHPLDPQIYTLIRYQGTHSREEALSQAIETQHSFNPYILNHGLKTPTELMKFFEDKIQLELTNVNDLKLDSKISRSLFVTHQEVIAELKETIAELKESAEEKFEEGVEQGRHDNAIYVQCARCGEPYQVEPQSEAHGMVTQALLEHGWGHASCAKNYEYVRRAGYRAL